jgi:hypothetical protein
MLTVLPTPRESVPREMCPPCLALLLGIRQTVRAFGSALDAFMVRVKELDGVLLQLIKVIGNGMAPPEQLSRLQRLIVDAGALAKVCTSSPGPQLGVGLARPCHSCHTPTSLLPCMCEPVQDASESIIHSHASGILLLQRLEARWTVTKILMASADTATLAALDTELSACLRDMQVYSLSHLSVLRIPTAQPSNPAHVCWL